MRLPFTKRAHQDSSPTHDRAEAGHALREGVLLARWFIAYELDRELARSRRHARPLSIIVLYPAPAIRGGHPLEVMVRVAAEAATAVARNTDLIGWLPGERIIVIMPETDEDQARAAAFRWRNEMYSRTSHLGGLRWNATAIDPFTYPSGEDLLQALSKAHIPGERAA